MIVNVKRVNLYQKRWDGVDFSLDDIYFDNSTLAFDYDHNNPVYNKKQFIKKIKRK